MRVSEPSHCPTSSHHPRNMAQKTDHPASKRMHAALVNSFAEPPRYQENAIDVPELGDGEVRVKVLSTGLSNLVKMRAKGAHYSMKAASFPIVPGVDGVGRLPDGQLVYFLALTSKTGSYAEYVNVPRAVTWPLPETADVNRVAALANAVFASWLALARRRGHEGHYDPSVEPKKPFTVFILGVTGASGRLATQVARLFGAQRVIGAGRNRSVLDELSAAPDGIDAAVTLALSDEKEEEATRNAIAAQCADVDVVLDFLWGPPAKCAMTAVLSARPESGHHKLLEWIQIGQIAGASLDLPASYLRSQNFFIGGSGFGPQDKGSFVKAVSAFLPHLASGKLTLPVKSIPLKKIDDGWGMEERVTFTL